MTLFTFSDKIRIYINKNGQMTHFSLLLSLNIVKDSKMVGYLRITQVWVRFISNKGFHRCPPFWISSGVG